MFRRIISAVLSICIILLSFKINFIQTKALCNDDNIRACWISYLDIQTYLKGLSEEEFRAKVDEMYNTVLNNNMNTVIVQARAMADAIYPSEYFPWSVYISEDREALDYDPFGIMVEIAKEKGLRIEAWVNPYRVSLNTTTTNSFKETEYYEQYKHFIMEYSNASGEVCLSLDPSKSESINLIVSGIEEILNNYEVDSIHFDDYFYVSGMAPQLDVSLRQEYVNNMVKSVYDAVKSIDSDCEFGISPAGNIDNAREQGADIDTWLSVEGYIDYIMPQIYWTDIFVSGEGTITLFTNRCNEWKEINVLNLPMYLGMGLYRVGEDSSTDLGWSLYDDNLSSQYETAKELGFDGYALFRYQWLLYDDSEYELTNLNEYIEEIYSYPFEPDSYVSYSVKNNNQWEMAKTDGIRAGNVDNIIYHIIVSLGEMAPDGNILYRVLYSDGSWSPWCVDGVDCGNGKNIVNVQIKLYGEVESSYNVYYRCCFSESGWAPWAKNGENANIEVCDENMTGLQVKLVKK